MTTQIAAQWAAYEDAYKAGDVARLGGFYTDSVWLRGPDPYWQSVRGRESAESILAQALPQVTAHDITFSTEDLVPLGVYAFESGTWSEDYTTQESPEMQRITGAYSALWEQQGDGVWRISRLIWNVHS